MMTLLRPLGFAFGLFILISRIQCREPCFNDQPLISKLTQRVQNTAPGYSIEDDCRMYVSHPSVLGGGHEAVFVDNSGHIEETEDTHGKAFAKDNTGGHLPIDGLPVKFHADETSYTNDLFSHGPNEGRVLEQHEIINDFIPKGDSLTYVSTPNELAESDADLHLSHMDAEENKDADVRMHEHNDENGFQSHHNERVRNREWTDDDGNHHMFYHYNFNDEHGDDHGGGHRGGGHHDDDHHGDDHGGGHHGGGHHDDDHHGGHHEESHHGGEHGSHHGEEHGDHDGHGGGGHHGGEHGESHHGGGHGESHHGEHEEGGHHGEHHHFASEDHGEKESSGDGDDSNKKLSKENKESHKEVGSYTQDGKTHKVEFSEEEVNPYHGKNKESEQEEKDNKDEKNDKSNPKSEKENKSENFVFVLGGKSNKKFNNNNLPQVFKQLVNDAKILTSKYHGGDESSEGAGSGEGGSKENKMKNILKLPRFHSESSKESEETGKNKEKSEKSGDDSKLLGILKNYVKSKQKKIYPGNEDQKTKKFNNYDLGDLGASVNKESGDKHNIDRIADNIINKFTTKTGNLQLPNDVVKNTEEKTHKDVTQKEQKERCCVSALPPPPPSTPPPQIVVELPQFQLYPPTSAPPINEPSGEQQSMGKQQRLQKLMRQKQRLDQLESEYQTELSSFKEELKKKDSPSKDDKEDSPDLFLPKEMNGCKDSKTFEKLKECIEEAKVMLNKNKDEGGKDKETDARKPTGTATRPVAYKGTTEKNDDGENKKDNNRKKVEQDSDSQSVDILGKDKKINEERKEKEKKKEDSVFQEENDNSGVPEPVQMKITGKEDEKKKEETEENKKDSKDEEQKNKETKEEEQRKEPFQLPPDDTDKDQNMKAKDNESKPNPSKVKKEDDTDKKKSEDDVPTPKNEKDKDEIVNEISKLQKALSSYYKTTKSPKTESTPIVLVHEIRLVKDDKNKEKEKEVEKLNSNIKNLQNLLKDTSKERVKKCGSFFLKGQLVFDKDCGEKRRSRIRKKQIHKKI